MISKEQLRQLRKEIVLNSLFYSDYQNSLGIDEHDAHDFFEGYIEYKMNEFEEDNPNTTNGQKDAYFYDLLHENNIDDMFDYYMQIEGDALPIKEEK